MWINYIKTHEQYKNKMFPIYYNAWENDDYENALIPLMAEISSISQIGESELLMKFKKASGAVIKTGLINLVKKATGDLVDINAVIAEMDDKELYDEQICKYKEAKAARKSFALALDNYAKSKAQRLLIFIDELDRCRPTFAIETLERIKHYFDVESVQFILMLDQEQLSNSVKVLYGNECDTSGYLRRFIDIEVNLPQPDAKSYFKLISDPMGNIYYQVSQLGEFFNLTLRDYNKLNLWINALLSVKSSPVHRRLPKDLFLYYAYYLIIKLKYPEIYQKLLDRDKLSDLSYEDMPNAGIVDQFTKEESDVRVVLSSLAIIKQHYGLHVNTDGEISERERAWKEEKSSNSVIVRGWKGLGFLDIYVI
jgi:hypothetical protein